MRLCWLWSRNPPNATSKIPTDTIDISMKKWALNEATLPIKPVKDFPFKRTDKVFFDANVWLYIYFSSAISQDSAEAAYSAAWQDILTAQSNVYIDALIVSEIINVHARSRYRIRKRQGASFRDFKVFRKSSDFRPMADEISFQVPPRRGRPRQARLRTRKQPRRWPPRSADPWPKASPRRLKSSLPTYAASWELNGLSAPMNGP